MLGNCSAMASSPSVVVHDLHVVGATAVRTACGHRDELIHLQISR
jgi:hypothetical protein